MIRMLLSSTLAVAALLSTICAPANGALSGQYMEARTCQVYTGPCFANAEAGLMGQDAMMAWRITGGEQNGVDLSGLNVVVVVKGSATLGFGGISDAKHIRSVILVDDKADARQRSELIAFARLHSGKAGKDVARISSLPIQMKLDTGRLQGRLTAGKEVVLSTRKAVPSDCICSNESAYYPPLAKLDKSVAGVAIEGEFKGRSLKTNWSIPESRSAYMGMFKYE